MLDDEAVPFNEVAENTGPNEVKKDVVAEMKISEYRIDRRSLPKNVKSFHALVPSTRSLLYMDDLRDHFINRFNHIYSMLPIRLFLSTTHPDYPHFGSTNTGKGFIIKPFTSSVGGNKVVCIGMRTEEGVKYFPSEWLQMGDDEVALEAYRLQLERITQEENKLKTKKNEVIDEIKKLEKKVEKGGD
jgi:hypothetical protein